MAPNFGKPPALKEQFCARQLQFQSWWARRLPRNLQRFSDALAGLSVALTAAFQEGRQKFLNVETLEGGLAPYLIANPALNVIHHQRSVAVAAS